ncbi:hypothetical protein C4J97_1794 [Pseudomonas orientalis]|nr:hypothetical protein C4J97_1794 [Pseudomonas orientalis]
MKPGAKPPGSLVGVRPSGVIRVLQVVLGIASLRYVPESQPLHR